MKFKVHKTKSSVFSWTEIEGISPLPQPQWGKNRSTDDLFKLDDSWHDVPIIREIMNCNDRKHTSLETAAGKIGFLPCPEMSVLSIIHRRCGRSEGQPWGFVDQCLTARTVNNLHWHELGGRMNEKGSSGYALWPGVGDAEFGFRLGRESQNWLNERMRLCQAEKCSITDPH